MTEKCYRQMAAAISTLLGFEEAGRMTEKIKLREEDELIVQTVMASLKMQNTLIMAKRSGFLKDKNGITMQEARRIEEIVEGLQKSTEKGFDYKALLDGYNEINGILSKYEEEIKLRDEQRPGVPEDKE